MMFKTRHCLDKHLTVDIVARPCHHTKQAYTRMEMSYCHCSLSVAPNVQSSRNVQEQAIVPLSCKLSDMGTDIKFNSAFVL